MTTQNDIADIIIHMSSFFIKNCFTAATGIADVIAARIIQPNDIISMLIIY